MTDCVGWLAWASFRAGWAVRPRTQWFRSHSQDPGPDCRPASADPALTPASAAARHCPALPGTALTALTAQAPDQPANRMKQSELAAQLTRLAAQLTSQISAQGSALSKGRR
jgi:hypothetical protein